MSEKADQAPRLPWWRVIILGRNPRRTVIRSVILIALSWVVFTFILLPIRVEGISMLPTYHTGQINFINRFAYIRHKPRRGDVVGIRLAGPHLMFMKRVIGLPGESLAFERGQLLINGQPVEEPYLKIPYYWTIEPQQLGPDEYYVVGDNRSMAPLDHEKGAASFDRIVGKVLL